MRRFASIDLMRGGAIWMMVIFHVIMRYYDYEWIRVGNLDGVSMGALAIMVMVIYFSAWAGFFLMVSAVGNMISMYRTIERGNSWKRLIIFQVVGGFLLLVAAVIVESTLGYHGALGGLVKGNPEDWNMILWRGYHMETIHTIALCVILNGVVQGLLSRNGGHRKVKRNLKVYLLLIVIVLGLTGPIWRILRLMIPGYPVGTWESSIAGELGVQYAVLGESGIGDVLLKSVMMPLGGLPEPLFPYLALSFAGSIVGMYLCQKDCPRKMPRNGIIIGLAAFLIGLAGTVYMIGSGKVELDLLTEYFFQIPGLYPGLWLWWFLFLAGGQVAFVLLVLRLVEFRGSGKEFGRRTLPWRRYGYVAFTVYTYQFIDVLPRAMYELFPDLSRIWPYPNRMDWLPALALIPFTLLLWEIVLRLWEKIEYAGGMEWCIAKIAETLLPGRRKKSEKGKWWRAARLDAREYLYKPTWLNVIEKKDIDHEGLEESRLSLSIGTASIFFFFLSPLAVKLSLVSSRSEGWNWRNRTAMAMGSVSIVVTVTAIIVLFLIPANIG